MGLELSKRGVLATLTRARIEEIGRDLGVSLRSSATKEVEVDRLAALEAVTLTDVLPRLRREELRSVCRALGLDAAGRARSELISRVLGGFSGSAGGAGGASMARDSAGEPYQSGGGAHSSGILGSDAPGAAPSPGQIVRVRHRQYLVEAVVPPPEPGQQTLVRLVCLDDDAPGRELEVLWERELGAHVFRPETHGLGEVTQVDPPRYFAAYLHALKWNCVSATDARLFQSPFRAGIRLYNHQLVPLKKALELPRVNLFIADDVGLGKTIEAGLVLQEMILRQRVDQALIVCPAAVALQWRGEMERRFGLRFEIYNRDFVGRRREERGYGVNPWVTYPRFIITYQTLRRPEYREPLLRHLGDRARKSLLILDEAHTAAPASAMKYAVDSKITGVIREIAGRFEHRLFLSATPHNGHSNSFSSLLEVLDPQRFTRGVDVTPRQLEPVMVRRLKSDLLDMGVEGYPRRSIVQIDLHHEGDAWQQMRVVDGRVEAVPSAIGTGTDAEIRLAALLSRYAEVAGLAAGRGKRGRLVLVNLQKRLLSSGEAFYRTLSLHARSVAGESEPTGDTNGLHAAADDENDSEYGPDDEAALAQLDLEIVAATRALEAPPANGRALLDEMLTLSEQTRREPGAKVLALLDWIRANQCPAVRLGGATVPCAAKKKGTKGDSKAWSDRRVIIFTEYGDTKRYLREILTAAFEGTTDGDARLMELHGGMSDQQRDEVQRAFNGPPDRYPVRVLLATDAAREGVNLQGHCADLFHFDVPWNPARLEQRNGRIDRTLQPSPEVRCHYFFFPQREEDKVLKTLVGKVDVIRRELGSLSTVVSERLAVVLDGGITRDTLTRIEEAERADNLREVAGRELEGVRAPKPELVAEDGVVARILEDSGKVMDFDPVLLRDAIDVGMAMAGGSRMKPVAASVSGVPADKQAFEIAEPPAAANWATTFDTLRPPRTRDQPIWEWRKLAPRPVVFEALPAMTEDAVQLHLSHPLVTRILARFRAQGFAAHDLNRVTVVRSRRDALVRVIAFGRLSLFGPGATRLHEEVIGVAAQWIEGRGQGRLKPFADEADRAALRQLETLLAESPEDDGAGIGDAVKRKLLAVAPDDFAELWKEVGKEADAREHDAVDKLKARGAKEAKDLRAILETQQKAILKTLAGKQLGFGFTDAEADRAQHQQWDQDRKHMEKRLGEIDGEMEKEPRLLEEVYRVALRRLEPVGLVYLWPGTR